MYNKRNKILIAGDSYGASTYAYQNWTKRAFPDYRRYKNIALSGTSFWRTVDNLHHVKDWDKFKHCIIFWSEHIRIYVRSTNSFIEGEDPFLHTTSRDPSPWSVKTKGKHIFNTPVSKARLVQKNVEKSYELGIMERDFENLKAYSCLQYFYNVFYKKYPKVNFINIHCFPWLEEVAEKFDVDVNFKSSGNVIHVDGNMLKDFSTEGDELNCKNHMNDEQHTKFAKFISQIIDRLDNGDEITRNPDLRKINLLQDKQPLVCHMGMAGLNFKHDRIDLCYRAKNGTQIEHATFEDVMNDEVLAKQRLSLLKGEWPEDNSCWDCEFLESKGAESVRQRTKYMMPDQWYIDNVDPVTGKMKKLHRLEFRFNNKCNYACRHCSSEYSTKWNKLIRHNPDVNDFDFHTQKENSIAQHIDMSGMLKYLEQIEEQNEFLELEITGGEPFFQKEFYETLIMLTPYAHKIRFIVTTNGSIAGEFKGYNAVEILKPFKRTMIKFSMDGSKSFYEYFREGGSWDNVSKNIQHFKDNLNVRIVCAITISNMQSARMPEIYNDLKEFCNPSLYNVGEVIKPNFQNPMHIPKPLKEIYLKQCLDFIDALPGDEKNSAKRVFDFPLKMFETEGDSEQWDKFCRFTDRLDQIHKKNIFDYFPEWEPYWTTK